VTGKAQSELADTAQLAYEAYGATVNWTGVTGAAMAAWANLGGKIQSAWMEAAAAVLAHGKPAPQLTLGHTPRRPRVSDRVHYLSRGSADGAYPSQCRAAIVTEVVTAEYLGTSKVEPGYDLMVGLFVMNPEGTYHLNLNGGGCRYDPFTTSTPGIPSSDQPAGGTWHWAARCRNR
jgi:hypothetical protein